MQCEMKTTKMVHAVKNTLLLLTLRITACGDDADASGASDVSRARLVWRVFARAPRLLPGTVKGWADAGWRAACQRLCILLALSVLSGCCLVDDSCPESPPRTYDPCRSDSQCLNEDYCFAADSAGFCTRACFGSGDCPATSDGRPGLCAPADESLSVCYD